MSVPYGTLRDIADELKKIREILEKQSSTQIETQNSNENSNVISVVDSEDCISRERLNMEWQTLKPFGVTDTMIENLKWIVDRQPAIEVSEDCISKHDIWKIIEDNAYWVRYNENSTEKGMTLTGINQALNECPPVVPTVSEDCISRAKGEWIPDPDGGFWCSNCRAQEDEFIYGSGMRYVNGESKFCPNCGAKMKGGSA